MTQLIEYIIALANLYGMVNKEIVVEIYNSQNEEQITMEEVEKQLKNPSQILENSFIYPHKNYFVHEAILEFNEFDLMLSEKANKPHYVPNKKELLNYVDELYFEKSKEYKNLLNYIRKNFSNISRNEIEEIAEEIHDICQFEFNLQQIFNFLGRKGIEFESEESFQEFAQLVIELSNNTRLWENNGFTPNELSREEYFNSYEQSGKPFIRKKKKIGRNEPCPCGSGKKYKKCCIGK